MLKVLQKQNVGGGVQLKRIPLGGICIHLREKGEFNAKHASLVD
jgi:hypothetical protein